jgi:hypothetical protein
MNDLDRQAFTGLFAAACGKCFGYPLKEPLTEAESKLLYNQVFEETGLTIGWKSIKNYSFFLLADSPVKEENPSIASLDTLSRYVMGVAYTTEPERKKAEGHYPYWYRYREQFLRSRGSAGELPAGNGTGAGMGGDGGQRSEPAEKGVAGGGGKRVSRSRRRMFLGGAVFFTLAAFIIVLTLLFRSGESRSFTDDFHSVREDSLTGRGWWVMAKDSAYWQRRAQTPGGLSLFTLKGDNWPDPAQPPVIRNLLLRKISCDCWTLELHLKDFLPRQNWQQAGILLLEDTALSGKSLRISIAYNDYNGGYPPSRSVLIQAITSLGAGFGKPEEIAHIPLFNVDSLDKNPVLSGNLEHSALRIEKRGTTFRILYSGGISENTSFKEVVSHVFAMTPRYAGLFALKGFVDSSENMPALFTLFSLNCNSCGGL